MRKALLLLLLLASAFACIGNQNEVYITFPSVDYNALSYSGMCVVESERAVCRFDQGTAIVATASAVSVQIPLNADGTPSFELSDWTTTTVGALKFLSDNGALDLAQEDLTTIGEVQLSAGGVYGFFEHAGQGKSLETVFAASNELCTDNPVYVSDVPEAHPTPVPPSPSSGTTTPPALSLDPVLIIVALAALVIVGWFVTKGNKPKKKK